MPKKYPLKPYKAYNYDPAEGAILVFAKNAREAKKVSWEHTWCDKDEYIYWRVKLLPKETWDFFYEKDADKELLEKGIPHVIEMPTGCKNCESWGMVVGEDGLCDECRREIMLYEKHLPNPPQK